MLKPKDIMKCHDDGSTTVERFAIATTHGTEIISDVASQRWRDRIITAVNERSRIRAALEAAEHWLAAEAESREPGATKPVEILRVIRKALGKRLTSGHAEVPADEADDLLSIAQLFRETVVFYQGIDDRKGDDEGVRLKAFTIARIDAAIARAEGRNHG